MDIETTNYVNDQALPVTERRRLKQILIVLLLVLLPFLLLWVTLHGTLEARARDHFEACFADHGVSATVGDWELLWRAGARPRHDTARNFSTTRGETATNSSTTHGTGARLFFLDLNVFAPVVPFQTRTLVIPARYQTWLECIERRIENLHVAHDRALLHASLGEQMCTLDGKPLSRDYEVAALTDAMLRLRPPRLRGASLPASCSAIGKYANPQSSAVLGASLSRDASSIIKPSFNMARRIAFHLASICVSRDFSHAPINTHDLSTRRVASAAASPWEARTLIAISRVHLQTGSCFGLAHVIW